MGLRYRKRVKVAPGVHLNISKSGISTSVGKRGSTVNFSSKGTRVTTGIPGTGISHSQMVGKRKRRPSQAQLEKAQREVQEGLGLTDKEMKWLTKQINRHPRRFRGKSAEEVLTIIKKRRRNFRFLKYLLYAVLAGYGGSIFTQNNVPMMIAIGGWFAVYVFNILFIKAK